MAFVDHLQDHDTYRGLTQPRAKQLITDAFDHFNHWLVKYKKVIPKHEATYLRWPCILKGPKRNINYPQLYLLAKIHKKPLATQPIVKKNSAF